MVRMFLYGALLLCVLVPAVSESATLYMDPPLAEIGHGESAVVEIRLDVDEQANECVNLVDAVIAFPDTVQAVDTSVGRSILRIWVEDPKIDQAANQVTFAGGIPNGYCGRIPGDPELTNVLAEVIFRSASDERDGVSATTTAPVAFHDQTTLYLNDGFGTAAPLDTYGMELSIVPGERADVTDPWLERVRADTVAPEPFSVSLERDDSLFQGRYYIVFNTTDKQTGLAGYEVMEEPLAEAGLFRFGAVGAPWTPTRSPYVLEDQTLNSTIRVKATDKAGNEYIATLVPDESLREQQIVWLDWAVLISGGFLIVLSFLGVTHWIRRRRRREVPPSPPPVQSTDAVH